MSYQPALPPPQAYIHVAVTDRGRRQIHVAGFNQDRRILLHGWYAYATDEAWFMFRLGNVYNYPTFGSGNFQSLMNLTDPGKLWVRNFYRRYDNPIGFVANVDAPLVFDLEFSVFGG